MGEEAWGQLVSIDGGRRLGPACLYRWGKKAGAGCLSLYIDGGRRLGPACLYRWGKKAGAGLSL